jgi:membrane protein YdbS with pleckstrin-like domain
MTAGDLPEPSAGPFDPAGVAWTQVSPKLAAARRVVATVEVVVLAVAVVLLRYLFEVPVNVPLALVALVLFWGWGIWVVGRQVQAWGYAERADDLLVRHGIMWRKIVVVPYGRMQYVDVEAGPLDRVFGIARVQLHTAAAATDAQIPGLPPAEAGRLRDRLASRGQAQLAGL